MKQPIQNLVPEELIDGVRKITEAGVKWKTGDGNSYVLDATLIATADAFKIKLETGEEFESDGVADTSRVSALHNAIRKQLGLIKTSVGAAQALVGNTPDPLAEKGKAFYDGLKKA